MEVKRLNRRRPFSKGFEPVHPSTLCENPSSCSKHRVPTSTKNRRSIKQYLLEKFFPGVNNEIFQVLRSAIGPLSVIIFHTYQCPGNECIRPIIIDDCPFLECIALTNHIIVLSLIQTHCHYFMRYPDGLVDNFSGRVTLRVLHIDSPTYT